MSDKKYYAVAIGIKPGIYRSWPTCKKYVEGFPGAKYKAFATEKEAQDFIDAKTASSKVSSPKVSSPKISIVKRKLKCITEIIKPTERLTVFCDGSAINNGKKYAKASAGIVIWDAKTNAPDVIWAEPLPLTQPQTNQRAELYALARACEELTIRGITAADIYTDSMYSINCVAPRPEQADIPQPTKIWAPSWKRRGWKKADSTEILHLDVIKYIHDWLSLNPSVILHHIRAHQDEKIMEWPFIGNAIADWATWYAYVIASGDSKTGRHRDSPSAFNAMIPLLISRVKK